MTPTKNKTRARAMALAASLALGLAASAASAALIDIDVSGAAAYGRVGETGNTILTIDLNAALGTAAGSQVDIDGVGWDVTIEAFSPSWLEEAVTGFWDSTRSTGDTPLVSLRAGPGVTEPGIRRFTSGGIVGLPNAGGELEGGAMSLPDGILVLEFYDTFQDPAVAPDARWLERSTITVRTVDEVDVPAPATLLLLVSGIGLLIARRRRTLA
jgi:hypothetical protein